MDASPASASAEHLKHLPLPLILGHWMLQVEVETMLKEREAARRAEELRRQLEAERRRRDEEAERRMNEGVLAFMARPARLSHMGKAHTGRGGREPPLLRGEGRHGWPSLRGRELPLVHGHVPDTEGPSALLCFAHWP